MGDDETPGSAPLSYAKHEEFAQLVAAGEVPQRAYARLYPRANTNTCESNASRVRRQTNVSERILFLRRERLDEERDEEADLSRAGLLNLMNQVTSALTTAARVCEESGGTARQSQAIRVLIGRHAGRVERLTPARPSDGLPTPEPLNIDEKLARLPTCTCRRDG